LTPHGIRHSPLPPQNRRRKGGPGRDHGSNSSDAINLPNDGADTPNDVELATPDSERVEKLQITTEEALERLSMMDAAETANTAAASSGQASYCPECYLPLHPDPKPEQLFIFLHALRYTTSLGTFETELPDWAEEGWSWDRELG
jgi:tRNA pseudouridine synthase 9